MVGFQENKRARESVVFLLNDICESAVINFDMLALESHGSKGENEDGEDGSKNSGGGKRVEITLTLVCRLLGFV